MRLNGKPTEKERLVTCIRELAEQCQTMEELEKQLQKQNISTYRRRGKFTGVYFGNRRKIRLRSLVDKEELHKLLKRKQKQKEKIIHTMEREISTETVGYYIKSLKLTPEQLLQPPTRESVYRRTRLMNRIFKEFKNKGEVFPAYLQAYT